MYLELDYHDYLDLDLAMAVAMAMDLELDRQLETTTLNTTKTTTPELIDLCLIMLHSKLEFYNVTVYYTVFS